MPSTPKDYIYKVNFFTKSGTNYLVESAELISAAITQQLNSIETGLRAVDMSIIIDDQDLNFNPKNTISSLSVFTEIGNEIHFYVLQKTNTDSSMNPTLFIGEITDINLPGNTISRELTINAKSKLAKALNKNITMPLRTNYIVSSVFSEISTRAGVSVTAQEGNIIERVSYIGNSKEKAATLMKRLLMANGHYVKEKFSDYSITHYQLNFTNRNINVTSTAAVSLDSFYNFNQIYTDNFLKNKVKVKSKAKILDSIVNTVAFLSVPQTLPASATINFFIPFVNPYNVDEQTEAKDVSLLNYSAMTGADGSGIDITNQVSIGLQIFGDTAICTVTNNTGYQAFLNTLHLQGKSIYPVDNFSKVRESTSSQNKYGTKELKIENEYIEPDLTYITAYAEYLRDRYAFNTDEISFSILNDMDVIPKLLVGNRIHLKNDNTFVDSDFIITKTTHTIDAKYNQHKVDVDCMLMQITDYFELNSATRGTLDTAGNILNF